MTTAEQKEAERRSRQLLCAVGTHVPFRPPGKGRSLQDLAFHRGSEALDFAQPALPRALLRLREARNAEIVEFYDGAGLESRDLEQVEDAAGDGVADAVVPDRPARFRT